MGDLSLKDLFPRLFYISEQRFLNIDQLGVWEQGLWVWKLEWRREFFGWERNMLGELTDLRGVICLDENRTDSWEWCEESSRTFFTKSAYRFLEKKVAVGFPFSEQVSEALKSV